MARGKKTTRAVDRKSAKRKSSTARKKTTARKRKTAAKKKTAAGKKTTARKKTAARKKTTARKKIVAGKKTVAGKRGAKKRGARKARGGKGAVRVRMYRHGLGDCFLLSLPSADERPFHLMIDCGVILGTEGSSSQMKRVVRSIIEATDGQVDLLVVTHEHWDHLSGFVEAEDLFAKGDDRSAGDRLRIRDLWLAWTENPSDDLANLLRDQRRRAEHGLRLAVQSLRAAERDELAAEADDGAPGWAVSNQVGSLLSFFGASSRSTADALEAVRGIAQNEPRYCLPGEEPIEIPGVPGIRFWVMGPPRDQKLLKKSRPSSAHSEVYESALALSPDEAFLAAALDGLSMADDDYGSRLEGSTPFESSVRVPELEAQQWPFFQERYWGDADEQDFRDQSWRKIDADWLYAASELALKLDSNTNNTSLVLAIELVDSGRVLLFPGDAQVGNWLSWQDLSWTLPEGEPVAGGEAVAGGTKVTGSDLLARTVLYKVGHHASHNATLRDQGLELMNDDELVAMIPTNEEMAKKKRWNQIPFRPLLERLGEKTQGRVMRADDAQRVVDRKRPSAVSASTWSRFQKLVEETELYFEYPVAL